MKTLILWSLTISEEISRMIKDSYKQSRQEDDLNQPLSVQAWGQDDDKRKYWLIEGQDDTNFRLYREGNRALKNIEWRSVAGSYDEIKAVANTLDEKHHSQAARRLASRINAAVPRFEATEEVCIESLWRPCCTCTHISLQKRRRREYRQIKKAQFARPEPGYSMYEGRTRGKRMRYTYDDDDDDTDSANFASDAPSTRRSARHQSNGSTPAETGPTVTSSGRTVRPRGGGVYGESLLSGQATTLETGSYAASENSDNLGGRATRANHRATTGALDNARKRKSDFDSGMSQDSEDSGNEWDGDEEDGDDFANDKEDSADSADEDDMSVDEDDDDEQDVRMPSLIVKLKVANKEEKSPPAQTEQPAHPGALPQDSKQEQQSLTHPESMDLDSDPAREQLIHPLPFDPSANGDPPASKHYGNVSLPNAVNKPQIQHSAQVQQKADSVQANGWS